MNKVLSIFAWLIVALTGAGAVAVVAIHRGEPINALWLVVAATCCYALGYRFYSSFIAARILALDARRATPAERLEMAAISSSPTSGSSSDIILLRSPAPDH